MRITVVLLTALLCLNAKAETDEALVAAAEKLVAESQADLESKTEAAVKPETLPVVETKAEAKAEAVEVKESEIPVTLNSQKPEKAESNVFWRLIASLGFISVVGGVLLFAARRWSRQKDKGGKQVRIEIVHQLHLGPRKSIALIRVAGEVMLVGITDHNINLMKPIALIDDELEGVMKKDFHGFLEDEFSVEDVRTALSSRI